MRKLATATVTAISLGLLALASPAAADQTYGPRGGQVQHDRHLQYDRDGLGHGHRNHDWRRYERGLDQWERGWGRADRGYGHHEGVLSRWQITRRLERQGFFDVRGLRDARWGWGLRAFAYDRRGRPVMLRVNPYNGRVMDVRYV